MSYDFLMDPDGQDLVYSAGKMGYTQSIRELLRNKLYISFRAFKGEYFYNTDFGIYDKNIFLNKTVTKNQVDAYLISEINSFEEVDELRSFQSEYDPANRIYSLTFVVRTITEENGIFTINMLPPGEQIKYPDPQDRIEAALCEVPTVENSNAFYELLNFELPTDLYWL